MKLKLHLLIRAFLSISPRIHIPDEIKEILKNEKRLTIVQVGANNGKTHDPLFTGLVDTEIHESHHIEALPRIWKDLKSNYSLRYNSYCHNLLIAEEEGLIPFFTIKESSAIDNNLPVWWRMIGSLDVNHARKHFPTLSDDDIEVTNLKATTPARFLEQVGLESIDLLHIDCEGADYTILKGFLKCLRPSVVLIEHKHLTLKELFLLRMSQFILGYSCQRNKDDFLFTKRGMSK